MAVHLRGRSVRTVAGVLGVGIILSAAPAVVHARLPAQAPGGPDPASPGVDVTVGGDIGSHPTLSGDGRLMAYEGVVDLVVSAVEYGCFGLFELAIKALDCRVALGNRITQPC